MFNVLVACYENWDTLMELPAVLTKGGCSVTVFCSKKSWLLKNKFYINWIESPTNIEEYKQNLVKLSESNDPYYDWIILGDEKLLKVFSECPTMNTQGRCRRILPVNKLENKMILGSKYGLSELCTKYSITTPKYLQYNHETNFDTTHLPLQFPILLKQDLSWGGGGIVYCNNQTEFEIAIKKLNKDYPYVFQEFIEGKDIGVEAFYCDGVLLNYNAGEVASYFKSKFSFTTKRMYFLSEEIKILVAKIGIAFGINGFASIQLIYKESEKTYYLLEADLRPNIYIPYGRFTGQDFVEAIKKKINPSYSIPPNTKLKYGETMEIAIFYRDIIRCIKQKDIAGVFRWIINYKGYWRFIPLYDLTLCKHILKELFLNKVLRKFK